MERQKIKKYRERKGNREKEISILSMIIEREIGKEREREIGKERERGRE